MAVTFSREGVTPEQLSRKEAQEKQVLQSYSFLLFQVYLFIASDNHLVKPNQRKKAREPIVYSTWINVLGYKRMRSILEETKESYPEKTNNPM